MTIVAKRSLIVKPYDAKTMNDDIQNENDNDPGLKLDYAVYDSVSSSNNKRIYGDPSMLYAVGRMTGVHRSARLPEHYFVPDASGSGGYKSNGFMFFQDHDGKHTEIEIRADIKAQKKEIGCHTSPGGSALTYMVDNKDKTISDQNGFGVNANYTLLFTAQDTHALNFAAMSVQTDARYVLFLDITTELPELDNYIGIITTDSRYIAPMMYKTQQIITVMGIIYPIYINIGPIYGKVYIDTIEGHPFARYNRSYISGMVTDAVFRTAFIPFRETQEKDEEPTEIDGTPGFNRYHDAVSGEVVSFETYKVYNNHIKSLLAQYFPIVLTNLMGYLQA